MNLQQFKVEAAMWSIPEEGVLFLFIQAKHETGNFTSSVWAAANNAFGMKRNSRQYSSGAYGDYAKYDNLSMSIGDAWAWLEAYGKYNDTTMRLLSAPTFQARLTSVFFAHSRASLRYAQDPDYYLKLYNIAKGMGYELQKANGDALTDNPDDLRRPRFTRLPPAAFIDTTLRDGVGKVDFITLSFYAAGAMGIFYLLNKKGK